MDFKNKIIAHLSEKGQYSPEVDDYEIDILIQNVKFAEVAINDIKANGLIVSIPNGNGIITTKENPAFGTYDKCIANIHRCSSKLGISRIERLKLKLLEEKKSDEFDNDFN